MRQKKDLEAVLRIEPKILKLGFHPILDKDGIRTADLGFWSLKYNLNLKKTTNYDLNLRIFASKYFNGLHVIVISKPISEMYRFHTEKPITPVELIPTLKYYLENVRSENL